MIHNRCFVLWCCSWVPCLFWTVKLSTVSLEKSSMSCRFFSFPASFAYLNPYQQWIYDYGCVYTASLNAQIRSFDHIRFLGPSVYIHFRHDWYPISVFTLIPTQKDCLQWSLMHMVVSHRVLNGRAIKIIYIIHAEWLLLFASMDNGCHGCFAAQNLTERIKNGK